jgi:hypothetical protein
MTNGLPLNTWTHVVVTYDGSKSVSGTQLYVNGQSSSGTFGTTYAGMDNTNIPLYIGRRDGFFNGTIDNVQIWNRSLSATQVLALYQNKSNLIVSQELSGGQNWTDCVTPNDGTSDGTMVCSNNLLIQDSCSPPSINNNWTVSASDMCVKTDQNINLGTGKLIVTGTGNLRLVNTNVTASNIELIASGGVARVYLENGSKIIRPTS